jgi:hypothetical protein
MVKQKQIQTMHMKFLKSTEGKTRRNKIRNNIPTEVGTQSLTELVENQLQWFSHIKQKQC